MSIPYGNPQERDLSESTSFLYKLFPFPIVIVATYGVVSLFDALDTF
jgi:hypothetical protein|uniref:Uncharacterized protein n=1 Tax=virus sp. ctQcs9 TaxID=2825816 RepID=A0A8S5RAZ5_9VIRU|nr:MAG TPA: hypothetical protein [virus sp. ctQcs9]